MCIWRLSKFLFALNDCISCTKAVVILWLHQPIFTSIHNVFFSCFITIQSINPMPCVHLIKLIKYFQSINYFVGDFFNYIRIYTSSRNLYSMLGWFQTMCHFVARIQLLCVLFLALFSLFSSFSLFHVERDVPCPHPCLCLVCSSRDLTLLSTCLYFVSLQSCIASFESKCTVQTESMQTVSKADTREMYVFTTYFYYIELYIFHLNSLVSKQTDYANTCLLRIKREKKNGWKIKSIANCAI